MLLMMTMTITVSHHRLIRPTGGNRWYRTWCELA